jgi:hypothetical protein
MTGSPSSSIANASELETPMHEFRALACFAAKRSTGGAWIVSSPRGNGLDRRCSQARAYPFVKGEAKITKGRSLKPIESPMHSKAIAPARRSKFGGPEERREALPWPSWSGGGI